MAYCQWNVLLLPSRTTDNSGFNELVSSHIRISWVILTANSSSVVLVGIFVLVLLLWVERRKKFSGPEIDWDMLNASNS